MLRSLLVLVVSVFLVDRIQADECMTSQEPPQEDTADSQQTAFSDEKCELHVHKRPHFIAYEADDVEVFESTKFLFRPTLNERSIRVVGQCHWQVLFKPECVPGASRRRARRRRPSLTFQAGSKCKSNEEWHGLRPNCISGVILLVN